MPWQQYLQYLQDYVQHFDLTPRIQLNTRVTKVTPTADYLETGRYISIALCNIIHKKLKLLCLLIQGKTSLIRKIFSDADRFKLEKFSVNIAH